MASEFSHDVVWATNIFVRLPFTRAAKVIILPVGRSLCEMQERDRDSSRETNKKWGGNMPWTFFQTGAFQSAITIHKPSSLQRGLSLSLQLGDGARRRRLLRVEPAASLVDHLVEDSIGDRRFRNAMLYRIRWGGRP